MVNANSFECEYPGRIPRNESERFEIAVGAILTQNISWKNVVTALVNLKKNGLLSVKSIDRIKNARLASLIKSTGYYNQKAKKIKNFISWYRETGFDFSSVKNYDTRNLRSELLLIKGIGPETADSILLYALKRKIFVIDAYTRRLFGRMGVLSGKETYDEVQHIFHELFRGKASDYNEYHALIVAHGKDVCKKKPRCGDCCLEHLCSKIVD